MPFKRYCVRGEGQILNFKGYCVRGEGQILKMGEDATSKTWDELYQWILDSEHRFKDDPTS
jgi:hypothetical protein